MALRVEMVATQDGTGAHVGSLFYDIKLDDPPGGTPWSLGAKNRFRAGMTEANDCLQVLRKKLGTFPSDSSHLEPDREGTVRKQAGAAVLFVRPCRLPTGEWEQPAPSRPRA